MKQQYAGRKVVNWHRPLAAGDLSRRYRRERAAEGLDQFEFAYGYHGGYEDWEWDWDYYNCAGEIDYAVHAAWNELVATGPGPLVGLLDPAAFPARAADVTDAEPAEEIAATAGAEVELRLHRYLQQLGDRRSTLGFFDSTLHAACKDPRDIGILRTLVQHAAPAHEGLLLKVLLFAPFWIRRVRTWKPPAEDDALLRLLALVDHLFVRHPVPPLLYREWLGEPDEVRMKWLCWFILYGQGRSLYRSAPHFGWQIHRKFQRYFDTAPADLGPIEACMYAEVLRLGGAPADFARLRRNAGFVVDPTAPSTEAAYAQFWQETVAWLAQHRDAVTDDEADEILAWAMHEHTEASRQRQRSFSLRGRSPRRSLDAAREYRRRISQPYSALAWRGNGWDWEYVDGDGATWKFVELTKGIELFEEGKALHHCVANYAGRCAAGYSAIVSLRYGDERRITVEVGPHSGSIFQARGLQNRAATGQEQTIIHLWLRAVVRPQCASTRNT